MANISFSVSENSFETKPSKLDILKISFTRKSSSIDELASFISEGRAYTAVMNDDTFKLTQKRNDNFMYSQLITFDCDKSTLPLWKILGMLPISPTIAYNTCSNGKNGLYCYRLIYAIDGMITNPVDFEVYSRSLSRMLGLDILGPSLDLSSFKCSQMWFGCNGTECIVSDTMIPLGDIEYDMTLCVHNKPKKNEVNADVEHKKLQNEILESDFVQDFLRNNFTDFISSHVGECINVERSHVDTPEDEPIIFYPDDYREIRRIVFVDYETGEMTFRKFKDGDNRRRMLFLNGIIRRLITPSMTFNDTLYCLAFELWNYYINDGNKITKRELINLAIRIHNSDLGEYDELGHANKKFFVNPVYCTKYRVTKKSVLNSYLKVKNNKIRLIGGLYDFNKSVKENHKLINEAGLKVSLATVYNFLNKTKNS